MPRFFVEEEIPADCTAWTISGADAHHIRNVLRMAPGDELIVCDGHRTEIKARIQAITADVVELELGPRSISQNESPLEIWLFQGLPKGDKLDTIIQKAVELGAARLIPVICERSVARIAAQDAARKTGRWQKIAREAARQCGRALLPTVESPLVFPRAAQLASTADLALIPWENERERSIRQLLESQSPRLDAMIREDQRPRIAVLIGPEGGFAMPEIDQAVKAGIWPVSLGRRILRTETAGPAVLAMLGYQFNDF
jgi:16S rRNA (uracil1498-N3)-methyltransferase